MAVEFAPNPYSSDMAVIGKVDAAHTRQSARVRAREGELRLAGKPVALLTPTELTLPSGADLTGNLIFSHADNASRAEARKLRDNHRRILKEAAQNSGQPEPQFGPEIEQVEPVYPDLPEFHFG